MAAEAGNVDVGVSAEQIAKLDSLTPASGDSYNEYGMRLLER